MAALIISDRSRGAKDGQLEGIDSFTIGMYRFFEKSLHE